MADTAPATAAAAPATSAPAPAPAADEAKIREESLDQLARLLPDVQQLLDHGLDQKIRDAVRAEFARQNMPGQPDAAAKA